MKNITIVTIILIAVYSLSGLVFNVNEIQYDETTEVCVRQGDTLWSIASSVNNNSYDTRKIVNEIKNINDMDNTCIAPGQKLITPKIE